jgi:hypothetical protein
MVDNPKESSVAMLVFSWLLVGLPLAWGVYNTVLNSQKLFQTPPTQAAGTASPAK